MIEGERIVRADLRTPVPGLVDAAPAASNERAASAAVSDLGPHRAALADFIAAVRSGQPPACDGREGRRSLVLAERIYEAAAVAAPEL